ncbi:hypothetical protein SAMN02745824_2237 [Parasphingorhabdus marina DSM 22363]|uniref:Protease inhibitor Inh n=1 Tax=Parasphingorhabdus marina DSM 22363 TaxID=1123272 RepID=A0A1N6F570_9SPHN|nr:hypothetical protein [Parasphingorhabdus marina]SIN90354.1 hypothetical protein SAMN02745824_2237 [Parasphingorhabdus marina DSM 22363]
MKGTKMLKYFGAVSVTFFAFAASAPAQAPALALLDGLQKGQWTLKPRGSTGAGQQLCLGDPAILLQIRHAQESCSYYVIEDRPQSVRVSYKCGGSDHGVTTIRRESSQLVQIQSQGIKNNAPFSFSVEGRRTGSC